MNEPLPPPPHTSGVLRATTPLRAALREAGAVLLLALGMRALMAPLLGDQFPFITLYPAMVVVLARRGLPVALGFVLAGFALVEASAGWWVDDSAAWSSGAMRRDLTYVAGSVVAMLVGGAWRQARLQGEAARRAADAAEREQQRSRRAIAVADARLAAIVRFAHDGIAACDATGLVTVWNPAAERLLGWTAEEMLQRPVSRMVPPEELEAHRAMMDRCTAGEALSFEAVRLRRDGTRVPVQINAAPLYDAQGAFAGISAVLTDIAERRAAEEALRRSEATLRAFYDNAPVCMGITEPTDDGDILHVYDNRRTCELFGLAPGGTAGRLASEIGATAEARAVWIEHYRASLAEGASRFEYRAAGPDGRERWMTATVAPIGIGPGGRERFCYVSEDITERHELIALLAEREARALLALDIARLGTWQWHPQDGAMRLDARSSEILGVEPDTATTLESVLALVTEPHDRERARAKLQEALDQAGATPTNVPMRLRRGDGTMRWVVARGQRVDAGNGEPPLVVGTLLDVTEQRLAEQRLRDADRQKDQFLAILSHELRNPLSPLVVNLALLQRRGDDPAQRQRSLAVMERQLAHLVRLVDDLLDVSRIGQGRLVLNRQPMALATALEHAVEASRAPIEAGGHALVQRIEPGLRVEGDLTRLAQVFTNLLNNAAKYTPRGGRIELEAQALGGDQIAVRVIDNGLGIAPEQRERVFELFTQLDRAEAGGHGGLGIGLSIARQIVEMHGGRIDVASDGPGRGSVFTVTLPRLRDDAGAPPA